MSFFCVIKFSSSYTEIPYSIQSVVLLFVNVAYCFRMSLFLDTYYIMCFFQVQ